MLEGIGYAHVRNGRWREVRRKPLSVPVMRCGTLRREGGGTLLEFAFILMLFLLLAFGIIDGARMLWAYNVMSYAAREGTRYAVVHGEESGTDITADDIRNYVRSRALPLNPVNVTTTWEPDKKYLSVVQVTVQYSYVSVAPLVPLPPITLTSTSRMVISY